MLTVAGGLALVGLTRVVAGWPLAARMPTDRLLADRLLADRMPAALNRAAAAVVAELTGSMAAPSVQGVAGGAGAGSAMETIPEVAGAWSGLVPALVEGVGLGEGSNTDSRT